MTRAAIAAVTAALALALALTAAIAQPAGRARATGFDHLAHQTKVAVSGQDVACAACHPLTPAGTLAGRPGHAACFPCHGPAPRRGAATPAPPPAVCVVCHPAASLATRAPTLASPAYGPDHEHGLQLDHARHPAPCRDCHATGAATAARPRPHARCATCHVTGAPPMSACEACHPPAIGPDTRPHLIDSTLSVARAFSHERHAKRRGAPDCAACHQAIASTHARELPTPTAADCSVGGCHDGAGAFAITASCTRCHSRPVGAAPASPAPAARFVHRAHEALTDVAACDRCHGLDGRGQPTVAGHGACSDGACHQRDFGSPTPTTCGACHLASEPWRPLRPDQRPPEETELGVALSHRLHPGPCEGCHQRSTPRHPLRPPRGHGACTTAGCHATDRGPAPRLTACAGCHQPGVVDERRRRRSLALWSVAAAFDHARHRIDPRDRSPLACTACHEPPAAGADDVMPAPAKVTCAPCHDGTLAFKMTGHGCARCHRPEAAP